MGHFCVSYLHMYPIHYINTIYHYEILMMFNYIHFFRYCTKGKWHIWICEFSNLGQFVPKYRLMHHLILKCIIIIIKQLGILFYSCQIYIVRKKCTYGKTCDVIKWRLRTTPWASDITALDHYCPLMISFMAFVWM